MTLPDLTTVIHGVRLPVGARPSLASDLSNADRDLACRLLNRPADAPWWALRLDAVHWERLDGFGSPSPPVTPAGTLQAILIDSMGDPVVAAWINPDGDQHWYIIPDHSDWGQVIDWVVRQALPAYAPDALRRVRSPLFHDPLLMTTTEVDAQQNLADMEVRHAQERAELQAQLQHVRDDAEPVREALLHGTGSSLVNAVRAVLTSAGFYTVNLDHELGGSKSADLLATRGSRRILIEVKSTTGRAPESLTDDLQRHLNTWPSLRPDEPVHGAALVVNHQHRLPLHERSPEIYTRHEFVSTLRFSVINTGTLFEWWRTADWDHIRAALLDQTQPQPASTSDDHQHQPHEQHTRTTNRRWLRFGRGRSNSDD